MQRRASVRAWLLLAPLLAWLAAFVIAPNVIMLAYSFWKYDGPAMVERSFTLENCRRLFDPHHAGYLKILWRSVEYAAGTTVLCMLIGYPVAYYIGRASEAWRNRLLMLVMIPFWTSFLIRTYAWITILKQNGLLNGVLLWTKLISSPLSLFYTPTSVTIGLVYTYVPFMILPIYASVEKLDYSLVEAALDLGASPSRTFWNIILPLTRPGIVAGVLLVFIPAIGMYAVVDLMGGDKIITIGHAIQDQFIGQSGDWAFGSALGILVLVIFGIAIGITRGRTDS